MERVKGIEPSSQAWEARILPLNHTRSGCRFYIRARYRGCNSAIGCLHEPWFRALNTIRHNLFIMNTPSNHSTSRRGISSNPPPSLGARSPRPLSFPETCSPRKDRHHQSRLDRLRRPRHRRRQPGPERGQERGPHRDGRCLRGAACKSSLQSLQKKHAGKVKVDPGDARSSAWTPTRR